MADRYEIILPGKLTLQVDEEEGTGEALSLDELQPGQRGQGILEGRRRVPYIPRRGGITLYDLGTRKQEDGSYRHVSFGGRFVFPTFGVSIDPELRSRYHMALLAEGYLDAGALLKLPQAAQYLYIDIILRKQREDTSYEEESELIGEADTRPYMDELEGHADFPIGEITPPGEIVSKTHWKSRELKFTKGGKWHIKLDSGFFYNPFDTSTPATFKITESASPEGEGVDNFGVTSRDEVKIFLTPRCNLFGDVISDTESSFNMGRFLPVLPDFNPVKDPNPFSAVYYTYHFSGFLKGSATPAYWAVIDAYHNELYTDIEAPPDIPWIAADADADNLVGIGAPVLTAVIVKGGKAFYVWRTQRIDSTRWADTRVYNPIGGGA